MLDRFILPIDYGVSYGSVTLKSLQNENVPELDLLVREAIQNSSDAALKQPGPAFAVNFTTKTFCPAQFNSYLTDIEDYLNDRFPWDSAHFLEIRDVMTWGLIGPTKKADIKKEDHGNFFKLIYDTGKRQTQSGAGGNWGFGKSVYYRVGIGIVIFYSRIKTTEGYESRLIVTLVEDESKKNPDGSDATILNRLEAKSAGKAWWGIRDGEDLLPITDEEFINPVLSTFGLNPFKGTETGTSVIIPYIDPQELLDDVIPADAEIKDDVKEHMETVWTNELANYLRLAIQKWYAPKVQNTELRNIIGCDKKMLIASVNNVPMQKQKMLPFFQLVQELYTTALARTFGAEYKSTWLPQIECMAVNIQKYFEGGTTSGYVAAVRVTRDEFNCGQNVLSPYVYIGKYEAEGGTNEPIVMFSRDPGMVIDYSITGPWVKNISAPESDDEFLFAFYMPDTKKKLKAGLPVAPEIETLGDYLRDCEASDHMGWDDPAKMQIVTRIQKNTVNQINQKFSKGSEIKVDATASKLAAKLGRSLLPRVGYCKKKPRDPGPGSGPGGTKLKNLDFEILSMTVSGKEIEIPFRLKFAHSKKAAEFELIVASEGGWITPSSWQNDIGTAFPASIQSFTIQTIATNIEPDPIEINAGCTALSSEYESEKVSVSLIAAEGSHELTSVKINAHILNMEMKGVLKLLAYDKKYRFSIKVE